MISVKNVLKLLLVLTFLGFTSCTDLNEENLIENQEENLIDNEQLINKDEIGDDDDDDQQYDYE